MQPDWNLFLEKYKDAPQYVRDVLNSEEIADFLCTLQPRLQNDSATLSCIINLCTDYMLGSRSEGDFVKDLGFSADDTSKILGKLKAVLSNEKTVDTAQERLQSISAVPEVPNAPQHIPESQTATIPDADNAIRDELLLKPRMTEKIIDRSIPQPGAKPLTREDILQSLAAKRTLASDVSALQQNREE